MRKFLLSSGAAALLVFGTWGVWGAWNANAAEEPVRGSLDAMLLDAEQNAKARAATVEAKVQGVNLTDATKTGGVPKAGQAHVHYRVDNGPVIATTATKLSFHDLSPGSHVIAVWLADNSHQPLTSEKKLQVTVP